MKKLLLAITAVVLVAGTGIVFGFKKSGPSQEEIAAGIGHTWNVQRVVQSAMVDGEFWVELAWKDATKANQAATEMCSLFPVATIVWEPVPGHPRSINCK
ncbi:hypothetical protein [Mesorhizobium sp. WSM2239]|uniref:Uncharacterized protein n=2 Tax=unclassified Mesorhizobium TaxID=325217 RepID=A0AAU8D0W2_9HYPH